ncbi:MAG: HAD family hydrolase [Candidatus Omnitrophica bacterium]|nr:HAD family hydrolase [Candidatus Omnitrophota bacterium]
MQRLFKFTYLGVFLIIYSLPFSDTGPDLFRRARQISSLESAIHSQPVKFVALDVDFTLADRTEPISRDIVKAIFDLNEKGIAICIISGVFYEAMDRRVIAQIRQYQASSRRVFDWENFYIFAAVGSEGYAFDREGRERQMFQQSFTQTQNDLIEKVAEDFKIIYGLDSITEVYRSSGKFTAYFKNTGTGFVAEYVHFLTDRLSSAGIRISAAGNSESVDITIADKGDALRFMKSLLGLQAENIMVVGDSFKYAYGNDRPMIIDGALVFNVGDAASDPRVINTRYFLAPDAAGPQHTKDLLEILLGRTGRIASALQDIRFRESNLYRTEFTEGEYRYDVFAAHLPQLSPGAGYLTTDTGFVTIRVFKEDAVAAYYVIYPARYGYEVVSSQRSGQSGTATTENLIALANEAFGIEDWSHRPQRPQIQPRSAEILCSYLAAYFFEKNMPSSNSVLEAFMGAVDELYSYIPDVLGQDSPLPNPETIEDRLNSLYKDAAGLVSYDFSNYYLYYHIAQSYPGGVQALKDDLNREIGEDRLLQHAQPKVVKFLLRYIDANPSVFKDMHMPRSERLPGALAGIVEALNLNFVYIDTSSLRDSR